MLRFSLVKARTLLPGPEIRIGDLTIYIPSRALIPYQQLQKQVGTSDYWHPTYLQLTEEEGRTCCEMQNQEMEEGRKKKKKEENGRRKSNNGKNKAKKKIRGGGTAGEERKKGRKKKEKRERRS
ncbi:hypothetical protein M9H77_06693 [Catharanthus roseus]|uniref:Uncharacterized protein n=1 Tax=Catharanthus roseus TaxID=4058 RepID=A0ACC0BSU2_CATRO|nr:hypothetical protein M9H77_06693 [Catharanthus roseus]